MKKIIIYTTLAILALSTVFFPGCGRHVKDTEDSGQNTQQEDDNKNKKDRNFGKKAEEQLPETEEIAAIEIPEYTEKTLTITATGDCTLGNAQTQSYDGSFNAFYDSYGADYFFEHVRDVFAADDLTVVNLECVLSDSNDRVEKQFNLKGKPEYTAILTGSSVEACSLGNNHTYDYGESGFQETKQVLDEAGIEYAYTQQEGMYTTEDGVKVGIVSSSLLNQSSERTDALKSQIKSLRAEGADVIIACCHWGVEKDHYPTDYQKTTAHEMIDAGADLVIGNHPHVLQGAEVYKDRVILYSLGNFCFGGNKNPSDKDTMIYQQTFTIRDGVIQTDAIDAQMIPCRLSSSDGYNDYQPYICSGERRQSIIDLMNTYSDSLGDVTFDSEGKLLAE